VRRTRAARIAICHRTGSRSRPYRLIRIAATTANLARHLRHGDVAPRAGKCPRRIVTR
jgi:hypothetical protein